MQKIHTSAIAILALACLGTAYAEPKILPAQSSLGFTSKQMGVPVDGNFKKFDAEVVFDPKRPEATKIHFRIDLTSVSVGGPETEAEVIKPEWFHTKVFPMATFESGFTKPMGGNNLEISGKLLIKGITRDVVVPVRLSQKDKVTMAVGSFTLKRLDFKLGDTDWKDTSLVADEVVVKFNIALSGVAALY
jgi:polyisoprenoid-binding protein YceI